MKTLMCALVAVAASSAYAQSNPPSDAWAPTPVPNAPSARSGHTAVWTGAEMLVWAGTDGTAFPNTGARFDPSTSTWIPMSAAGAPSGRIRHTAVILNQFMSIIGGEAGPDFLGNSIAAYDFTSDTWALGFIDTAYPGHFSVILDSPPTLIVTMGTPGDYVAVHDELGVGPFGTFSPPEPMLVRTGQTVVRTESTTVLWGGIGSAGYLNTGLRGLPLLDFYLGPPAATSVIGAPAPRKSHTAVWTGTEMIVWGGDNGAAFFGDGGRYNPLTDTWAPMSTLNAPSPRSNHTVVWTGTEMIVWGGVGPGSVLGDGGRYDPATDTWTPLTMSGAPQARTGHTAVWTGSEMIVWGGVNAGGAPLFTGGRYVPSVPLPPGGGGGGGGGPCAAGLPIDGRGGLQVSLLALLLTLTFSVARRLHAASCLHGEPNRRNI